MVLSSPGPEDVFLEADGGTHVLQQKGSAFNVDQPVADPEALHVKVKRELQLQLTFDKTKNSGEEVLGSCLEETEKKTRRF